MDEEEIILTKANVTCVTPGCENQYVTIDVDLPPNCTVVCGVCRAQLTPTMGYAPEEPEA